MIGDVLNELVLEDFPLLLLQTCQNISLPPNELGVNSLSLLRIKT